MYIITITLRQIRIDNRIKLMSHKQSSLEKKFCAVWKHINGPELEEELRFHPDRKWRADFAHAESMTLIEVEGGIHVNGRHNRASGFLKDAEKFVGVHQDDNLD